MITKFFLSMALVLSGTALSYAGTFCEGSKDTVTIPFKPLEITNGQTFQLGDIVARDGQGSASACLYQFNVQFSRLQDRNNGPALQANVKYSLRNQTQKGLQWIYMTLLDANGTTIAWGHPMQGIEIDEDHCVYSKDPEPRQGQQNYFLTRATAEKGVQLIVGVSVVWGRQGPC